MGLLTGDWERELDCELGYRTVDMGMGLRTGV